jgi:hypothetical protein
MKVNKIYIEHRLVSYLPIYKIAMIGGGIQQCKWLVNRIKNVSDFPKVKRGSLIYINVNLIFK